MFQVIKTLDPKQPAVTPDIQALKNQLTEKERKIQHLEVRTLQTHVPPLLLYTLQMHWCVNIFCFCFCAAWFWKEPGQTRPGGEAHHQCVVQHGGCTRFVISAPCCGFSASSDLSPCSGNGFAPESVRRATEPLPPGHVLPGPAETVHHGQERSDSTPPTMRQDAPTEDFSWTLLWILQHFYYFVCPLTCCCCPLLKQWSYYYCLSGGGSVTFSGDSVDLF